MKRNHDVIEEVNDSDDIELLGDAKDYIMRICAMIVISVIALIVMILGVQKVPTPDKEYTSDKEYTYTAAILIDTKEESYQWVPRYGGRVQTRYEYIRTYEYTDDSGEIYRFTINMEDSDSSKYLEVDVRYKDNNPDTLQFNIGQLQDRHTDAWVFYKR